MPQIGTNIYTFQACFKPQIWRSWAQKMKLNIHLTKSPKRDHIDKLCLYMLGEHNCFNIPNIFQSGDIATKLENINLSYTCTSQNHSSVTILKHLCLKMADEHISDIFLSD